MLRLAAWQVMTSRRSRNSVERLFKYIQA